MRRLTKLISIFSIGIVVLAVAIFFSFKFKIFNQISFEKIQLGHLLPKDSKSTADLQAQALTAESKGDRSGAIADYEKVLATDPNNMPIKSKLASLYYEDKNYQKASDTYKSIAEKDPKDSISQNFAANSFRNMGKTEEAIEYYKKAIENGNMDSVANLVTVYNLNGQFDLSISLLNERLAVNPNDKTLQQLLSSTNYKKSHAE